MVAESASSMKCTEYFRTSVSNTGVRTPVLHVCTVKVAHSVDRKTDQTSNSCSKFHGHMTHH